MVPLLAPSGAAQRLAILRQGPPTGRYGRKPDSSKAGICLVLTIASELAMSQQLSGMLTGRGQFSS